MKTKRYSLILMCGAMVASACNDNFFNAQPDNLLNIDNIFSNRAQTEGYWGGLFSGIPDPWDQPYAFYYSAITDELDCSNWMSEMLNGYNSGALSSNNVSSPYAALYNKIRQCAIFLANVDRNTELLNAEGGAERIRQYKAEAKFLRAYYYWVLMKLHGPVPLMPLESATLETNLQIPRSSWDECVNFVMGQMEEAKTDLPEDYYIGGSTNIVESEVGRINQMIIDAVQSEITLFSASPFYNGNADLAHWTNVDGSALMSQNYDANKWTIAANQAKRAITIAESNGKGLYKVAHADPFTAAFLSVRNVFWDGWRREGIWIRPSTNTFQWESHAAPRAVNGTPFNGLAVFQEVVDDFRMSDGRSIKETEGYNENTYATASTAYYVAGTNNMYTNREPRFYAYVTFNGSVIPGAPKAGMTRVEFYATGNSGKNGAPRDWPRTGYTARKNLHPTYSHSPRIIVTRPVMMIRLSELYLNYAEALNEANPGHPDILRYLNLVRDRAGLPALPSGLSQDALREQIYLERRIELCFEGQRYFDVRRWKRVETEGFRQGGTYTGMNMDAGSTLSSPEFHTRTTAIVRREWHDRFYILPWPQQELNRNKQLIQAPGY
ncbi:RagB/SusD family nutrient uptake outer membrane protein [Sphingobacterium paludis]|nr:RagB/SusD family nutrient uptake outer membrane protein [Sphingobacterium paludis]